MFNQELRNAAKQVANGMASLGVPQPSAVEWAPTPFSGSWGFGTTACFQSAAEEARQGKNIQVPLRAQEIAQSVSEEIGVPDGFARIEALRGYINVYIDPPTYAQRVIETVLAAKDQFGSGESKTDRVMVEYSQPNTHKSFHVGHLRNVILGGSMANILQFEGYETVRANYLGDIGWHVIKWLWCYLRFHKGEEPTGDKTRWMQQIYTQATNLVEENPDYEAEARQVFSRWEARDPEIVALWKKTRQWSLEGFKEIYAVLGENFDVIFFESEVEEPGKKIVEELISRGLAVDERPHGGPVIVKLDEIIGLEKETYRVLVLLRSDGTSLYATKDIPLALKKFDEWEIDRSIYVIDVRQSLYLKQIFKLLELMGYEQAKHCHHLSYEIVNLPGNVTMSSREGTVVMFDDLLEEAVARASAIVEEKNPQLKEKQKQEVAWSVALGALKYPLLAVDNNKVATFDWDRALDFEGQASPYIQYAHVRANSILRRAGSIPELESVEGNLSPEEISLLDRISRFPESVHRAAQEYKPLLIANYAYDLAKEFTDFYQKCPVLKADPSTRDLRLRLTAAVRQTLANSLRLLGIQAPSVM
jgi:arginyl-tRNA synthetase